VTVIEDTFPPTLVSALQRAGSSNTVLVTFSEYLRASSATNPASYQVTLEESGQELAVTKAQPFLHQVLLTLAPWQPGRQYLLTVNDVQDTHLNPIRPNSRIAVGFWREAVPLNAVWRFQAQGWAPEPGWTDPAYDDSRWPEGQALLCAEPDALPLCAGTKITPLIFGALTCYFRTRFQLEGTTGRGTVAIHHAVDDGAVFYLNGQELSRHNMPAGLVAHTTWAASAVEASCASFTNNVTNLVAGENVLAVEVHQATRPAYDIVFGASLELIHQPLLRPLLQFARQSDGQIRLWWTEANAVLEAAGQLGGPWSDVADTPPVLVPPEEPARFFRLRLP
jgi:hypothetical protein